MILYNICTINILVLSNYTIFCTAPKVGYYSRAKWPIYFNLICDVNVEISIKINRVIYTSKLVIVVTS